MEEIKIHFREASHKTHILLCFSPTGPHIITFSSVQVSHSVVWLFVIPWTAAHQASLSVTNSQSLLKLRSFELVMPSNHLILCRLLLFPPSNLPSIRAFSNESALRIRWPNYWSFSFSISPSIEYSGLISFKIDGLDLLTVQGTLKSLLQHNSSKASILQCSHPYMTTGKTIALTRRTFVGKEMSLLLNMQSRLVIAFLPKSTRLLISWLSVTICSDFGSLTYHYEYIDSRMTLTRSTCQALCQSLYVHYRLFPRDPYKVRIRWCR